MNAYEKTLAHNAATRWLHSFRFVHAKQVAKDLHMRFPDRPLRVLELGCAHGKLADALAEVVPVEYVGVDTQSDFIEEAKRRTRVADARFVHADFTQPFALEKLDFQPDIVFALETLEHNSERATPYVFYQIKQLRPHMFVCSVPVEVGPSVWLKNVGSLLCGYSRHEEYTWLETFWAGLGAFDKLPMHTTGHKGFDWRHLAHSMRQYFVIDEIRKFPFQFVPAALSSTVFIISRPRW